MGGQVHWIALKNIKEWGNGDGIDKDGKRSCCVIKEMGEWIGSGIWKWGIGSRF